MQAEVLADAAIAVGQAGAQQQCRAADGAAGNHHRGRVDLQPARPSAGTHDFRFHAPCDAIPVKDSPHEAAVHKLRGHGGGRGIAQVGLCHALLDAVPVAQADEVGSGRSGRDVGQVLGRCLDAVSAPLAALDQELVVAVVGNAAAGDTDALADCVQRRAELLRAKARQPVLISPLAPDVLGRAQRAGPVHSGATPEGGACKNHKARILCDHEAPTLVETVERIALDAGELGTREVCAFLQHKHSAPCSRELRSNHGAPAAGAHNNCIEVQDRIAGELCVEQAEVMLGAATGCLQRGLHALVWLRAAVTNGRPVGAPAASAALGPLASRSPAEGLEAGQSPQCLEGFALLGKHRAAQTMQRSLPGSRVQVGKGR
mmetsp:Transcript_145925/g.406494  ORF Transcript_145925/g.406494 Transcript_145925/m.406494 type:complete len:374 (+) Transcript_145925:914-2035(+)